MSDKDVDAQFADIIAHWDDVESPPEGLQAADDVPQSSSAEPDGAPASSAVPPGVNPPLEPSPNPVNPPLERSFIVWRGPAPGPSSREDGEDADVPVELDAGDDDDDHFEPLPTAPLPPQEDFQFWGIIVGLVAGPLLMLWLVLFRPDVSVWWTIAALTLTIGGFVLLVMRQPQSRDEDDPDDGARI